MIKKIDFLKTSKLIAFALLFLCAVVFAQAPGIQWQKLYGGSSYEWFYKTIPTSDGGYIAVGQAASTDGDVTGTGYTKQDAWIVKTDACGNKQWDKILGGDGSDENFYDIKQTNDGGYIVVGSSDSSNNGTVSVTGKGLTDVWVVKLNSSGATQWQKLYGGSRPDQGYSVSQTLDGGYIVGGTTQSVDGDLSGNTSVLVKPVVMKLDTNGNLNWVKTYIWQSDWEILSEIIQTADGGYIFVGNSFNSGNSDAIAYKLNSTGVVTRKQLYGGNGYDRFTNVRSTSDGGYIVAGYSDTSNNGSVSATNHGGSDVWLVKLTSAGSKSWDTLLGGSGEEKITNSNLTIDTDGGYVICSSSTSSNSGNVTDTNHGAQDAWVFKTNSSGVIQWQKLIGGTADDQLFSIYNTANNNYILAGYSESSASGDIKDTNKGSLDAWLLKLGDVTPTPVITTTSATCFSAGTATISNYNASYSYTFLPVGPTIGTNGLISGMAVGTNYTVTASGGNCTSATSVSFSIAAQLSGASCSPCTSQRIINSSLVYSGEYTGWTLANTDVTRPSGSNQGVNFQRDGQINDLTQNLTKVNPQGNTSPVFNIKIGPYDAVPQASSNKASLEFYYDNVLYMRISTTNGVTTGGANVNYFNGASGNYATKVPMNTSGVGATVSATVQLTLPATVSNFGQLKIHYDGSGTTPVDDFYIGEVSLITTVATPAIPTVTTTVATCSSDGTATISNYNPSYTYTFTPTGPTVGPTGLISGMITGTNYIVKASIEGCQSSASSSFSIAASLNCTFVCNTKFYLSQYPLAGTTTLYELDNTTNPFTITSIGASPAGMKVNGIGYNTVDNLIYGIRTDTGFTNYMVRIDANGVFTSLGAVTNLPTGGYNSGAFDNGGNYYLLNSGSTRFYRIDVTTNTATLITLSRSLNVNDIVYDKITGMFFGYEGISGANILVSIDPATGTVTNIGASGLPDGTLVGALYVDASGDIFGNADNGSGFYQFNKTTGRAVKISNSIGANGNDGTNCPDAVITFPADLSVTKTDGKTSYIPGTTNTYTIVVSNTNGPYGVLGATVSDSLPAGIPAANMLYSVPVLTGGATTSITGSQTGALNDVVGLPVGATITYTITINVPVAYTGNLTNTVTVIPPVNSSDPTPGNNTATDTDTEMWPTCTFDNTNGGNTTPVPVAKSNISANAAPTITYLQNASASASRTNEFDFGGVNLTNSTGNTIPNVLIDISKLGFWTQNVSGTTFKIYAYNQANQAWEGTLGNGQTAYFKILGVSVNGAQITNPNIRLLPVQNSASVTGYHFASTSDTVSDVATSFTDGGTGTSYSITGSTVSLPQNLPVIDLGALANGSTLTNVKIRMGLVMPNNADAWVNNPDTGTGDIDYYVYGFADVWGTGYDFGDAPSSYGIAQHAPSLCSPAIYIGPNRQDYESSVTVNTTADADDLNMPNYDDENDSLPDFSAGQTSYSITLPYVNNAASGTVSAWIDWNNNGVFDASERANTNISTGSGNIVLTWKTSGAASGEGVIPSGITTGYKMVRTRIGTISSEILSVSGIAKDGEVEDRLLFVSAYCTKPGDFTTGGTPTKIGITVQEKLSGWPESIPNGHIALESKEKGFVITRVSHVSTTPDLTNDSIKDPKEGMLIYDIQDKCVKLFNGITWNCIRRTCNDTN
ncbi:DUF11 domain-containing protein [Epilithonimonas zeae]|uniref:DUF11 domain-containing protein n=1 Tax=Epilithonimonas zeae TaxID=1416779 RepID=UPI0020109B1B|nr:DUF11 domain-containing protein [Epilithonimonas zeae]UQB70466.1 DUF11 domain-containing protein [Epilithonimonas zeae]